MCAEFVKPRWLHRALSVDPAVPTIFDRIEIGGVTRRPSRRIVDHRRRTLILTTPGQATLAGWGHACVDGQR